MTQQFVTRKEFDDFMLRVKEDFEMTHERMTAMEERLITRMTEMEKRLLGAIKNLSMNTLERLDELGDRVGRLEKRVLGLENRMVGVENGLNVLIVRKSRSRKPK